MVLRPHILRYKGSVKKLDSAKMQQINKRMNNMQAEYKKANVLPRGMMIYGLGAFVTIVTPMVFLTMKRAGSASFLQSENKETRRMEREEGEELMQIEDSENDAK